MSILNCAKAVNLGELIFGRRHCFLAGKKDLARARISSRSERTASSQLGNSSPLTAKSAF
jgi:hypothetical protein